MKTISKIHNMDVKVDSPPSKAHTLRALIISSLAEGHQFVLLFAKDVL